jgi:Ca2+/Na+ antiporter
MRKSLLQDVLCLFLGISLVSTLVFIPLNKFQFSRKYGIYLILLYIIAITISILIESKIIS